MKKNKRFGLNSVTDLKVFLLFLLDNIRYPVDGATVMSIATENSPYSPQLQKACEHQKRPREAINK